MTFHNLHGMLGLFSGTNIISLSFAELVQRFVMINGAQRRKPIYDIAKHLETHIENGVNI